MIANNQKFIIKPFGDIPQKQWDKFVFENCMGYVNHLYQYIKIDEDNTSNISFAIIDALSNELLLIMPLYVKKSSSNEYTVIGRKGLVIKDHLGVRYQSKLAAFFKDYISQILNTYNNTILRVEIPALCRYNLKESSQLVNPLIFYGFTPDLRYTWVVDLKKDEEKILADCEETTRRAIKKYLGNQDYYFYLTNEKTQTRDIEDFYQLSQLTYERSGAQPKCKQYYSNIIANLLPCHSKTFFLRKKDNGEAVVAAIIFCYNNTARYAWGCSITEKPSRISKYFMYKIMLSLKRYGIEYFETGGAYPYLPKNNKKRGISDFKRSFGTFLHIIHKGTFYQD